MKNLKTITIFTVSIIVLVFLFSCQEDGLVGKGKQSAVIIIDSNASYMEKLAAKEIRRYVYVRTGELLPIVASSRSKTVSNLKSLIVIGRKDRAPVQNWMNNLNDKNLVNNLASQGYCLKTIQKDDGKILIVAGGDDVGTLYGAYRFVESLGVRFYLHGDTIPDKKISFAIPMLDITEKPLFELRGIQPFHDFPEGPDWWSRDDYKAIISQLPKMRMNFIGLHTYPESGVGPEPTVWIGMAQDIEKDGKVKFSSKSSYANTVRDQSWGYTAMKTSDFHCGGGLMFDRDDFSSDVMKGIEPWADNPDKRNELFNRVGMMLNESFVLAHKLGVKTCVGTESPLKIPQVVKERLKDAGKDPNAPETVKEVYGGMFERIMQAYPIDYYWLWTPEGWTWDVVPQEKIEKTEKDLLTAVVAAKDVNAPFKIATCGWVLGPANDRSLFDKVLPKDMPFSCINRSLGEAPVEPKFADITGRDKWAIPWLEDDPRMTQPQLWAGRMRKDAVDALRYGCNGLMGIHWRTRILSPTVSALAKAGWDQSSFAEVGGYEKMPTQAEPVISIGGQDKSYSDKKITDTNDQQLYQSVRHNIMGYRFWLPNGKYKVQLRFCEPFFDKSEKRIFDVKLQGKQVISQLDIFEKVGNSHALDYNFDTVVTNNMLAIDFVRNLDFPCISAIDIEGDAISKKLDCGGKGYKDYAADVKPYLPSRFVAADDFYKDWAVTEFGTEVGGQAAAIFAGKDCNLPQPTMWDKGPGAIAVNKRPWSQVQKEYTFVDEFAKLESMVEGSGNQERFKYWLNNFKYLKAQAEVGCLLGELDNVVNDMNSQSDITAKKKLASEKAIPIRLKLAQKWTDMTDYLISTVSNVGEMGTLANIEQHSLKMLQLLNKHDKTLKEVGGKKLGRNFQPRPYYTGEERIFVPTVRTSIESVESLRLKVVMLGQQKPSTVELYWRPIGTKDYKEVRVKHIARRVYETAIDSGDIRGQDFEYYVKAVTDAGKVLYWPASSPQLNQTVVVMP